MMRKFVIAMAAVAAITAGSTIDVSARGGGGGGHGGTGGHGGGGMGGHGGGGMSGHGGMGGMGHAGMSGGRGMGFAHASVGRPGFNRFAGAPHVGRFAHGNRSSFRHRFAFRHHRFFRHRVAFVGVADDGCWTRVWTRWGWRWISVCY
jgi:hypothetical protein